MAREVKLMLTRMRGLHFRICATRFLKTSECRYRVWSALFLCAYVRYWTEKVSFYKLELTPLDKVDPTEEEKKQAFKNAINYTWIISINNQNDTCKIINDNDYTGFKKEYVKQQGLSVEKSIKDEIINLCEEGTKGLKKLLTDVYKEKIELIDKIEGEDEGWYPLLGGEGNPQIAARVIADLVIVLKAIELYTSKTEGLDKSLIPEKASA